MFSLLYGLWEYVFRKEELRVLVLGLDKAGKTTLLEKLKVSDEVQVIDDPSSQRQSRLQVLPTVRFRDLAYP